MAMQNELKDALALVETKMRAELDGGHPYEALQYVQSYVARKKKIFGQNIISAVVFHGAMQLVLSGASSSAGTLLKWFIEDGAGVDNSFKLCTEEITADNYCDVQRTIDMIKSLSSAQSFPIVDAIYAPLHLLVAKSNIKKYNSLSLRLDNLEGLYAKIFLDSGRWLSSFKSYIRLGMIQDASQAILVWSSKGYPTEKPLFFARAIIYLLSEGKKTFASELLKLSAPHIDDNTKPDSETGGPNSGALAVWHLATILTELAEMPPMPRVDKAKLFGLLYNRYGPLIVQLDSKLLELLTKAGEAVFGYSVAAQQAAASGKPSTAANPMAMLQGLLGGGGGMGPGGSGGGLDMEKMMSMMSKMQGAGRR